MHSCGDLLTKCRMAERGEEMTGFYDVKDFGAAGDGRTKDTAAIQSALDACGRAGGGCVRLA